MPSAPGVGGPPGRRRKSAVGAAGPVSGAAWGAGRVRPGLHRGRERQDEAIHRGGDAVAGAPSRTTAVRKSDAIGRPAKRS